jgi:hypothetical protein
MELRVPTTESYPGPYYHVECLGSIDGHDEDGLDVYTFSSPAIVLATETYYTGLGVLDHLAVVRRDYILYVCVDSDLIRAACVEQARGYAESLIVVEDHHRQLPLQFSFDFSGQLSLSKDWAEYRSGLLVADSQPAVCTPS